MLENLEAKFNIPLEKILDMYAKESGISFTVQELSAILDDPIYHEAGVEQINEIETRLSAMFEADQEQPIPLLSTELKRIMSTHNTRKRESKDSSYARKILNQQKIIENILMSDTKFNPVVEMNISEGAHYFPVFNFNKSFVKANRGTIIIDYYAGTRVMKPIRIIKGTEQSIVIDKEMIVSVDFKQYPYYIWDMIQKGLFSYLSLK